MNWDVILATKLRNAFKKANKKYNYNLQFDIKNVIINGEKRGCSGFITNKENGSCVYVDTEKPCCLNLGVMYRYADNNKDFTGYSNRWTGRIYDVDSLADAVLALLDKTPKQMRERKI